MFPKVRKSAKGCSKCKIVLQTQESAQKVLSAIGKGLPERPYILAFFVPFRLSRRWAWPRLLSLSFLMFWKPFVRLRYFLRVTFFNVGRFQTGFYGGYHSPFHFHSKCRFELFHSVCHFQLLWHVSPSRWFFSACVAFQLAIVTTDRRQFILFYLFYFSPFFFFCFYLHICVLVRTSGHMIVMWPESTW